MPYYRRLKRLEHTGSMFGDADDRRNPDPYVQMLTSMLQPVEVSHRFKVFWIAQDGKCRYCKIQMEIRQGLPTSATWDHIIPRSRGGTNTRENVVLACNRCNNLKGSKSLEEFLKG